MDIAALLGFIGAVGMILAAMIAGGGVAPFVDNQSILIVFGGSFFAVLDPRPKVAGEASACAPPNVCVELYSCDSWRWN